MSKMTFPYGARLDRYDYWRLVMPGEKLERDDEHPAFGYDPWITTCNAGEKFNPKKITHARFYRRRVKKGER